MGVTHHDGVSVYGSGLWWGKNKNTSGTSECPFFGSPVAGLGSAGSVRCDGGKINVSSAALAVSTNLSTVLSVVGIIGTSTLATINIIASGHCIDIVTHSTSGTASSGLVYWQAFGY